MEFYFIASVISTTCLQVCTHYLIKIKSLFERTEILPLGTAFSMLSKSALKLFVKEDIVKFQSYLYL